MSKSIKFARDLSQTIKKLQNDGHDGNLTRNELRDLDHYEKSSPEHRELIDKLMKEEEEKIRVRALRSSSRRQNRPPTPIQSEYFQNRSRSPFKNSPFGEPVIDGNVDRMCTVRERSPTPINNDSWDISNEHRPFTMGTLKNIGNSCYMNAVLYTLRLTPTLLHEVHHLFVNVLSLCTNMIELDETVPNNVCYKQAANYILHQDRISNLVVVEESTVDVIIQWHDIWSKLTDAERRERDEPIKTNELQSAIFANNSTFVPLTQQDSHEFLMCVMNCLRDCSDQFLESIENYPQMYQRIQDPETNLSFDFFRTNFTGRQLSTIRCLTCETDIQHEEEIINLFVPMQTDVNIKQDFIRTSCLTRERMEDKFRCKNCGQYTESYQITTFPQLPRILILQLGRFDNNMNKIKTVSPTPLSLDCFCVECTENADQENGHQYHLYGVIVHLGDTLRSGHYMTYIKVLNGVQKKPHRSCEMNGCCSLMLKQNDQTINDFWYICDDDKITVVPEFEFLQMVQAESSRITPYILFYARSDLISQT